jgi:hypothetical protein
MGETPDPFSIGHFSFLICLRLKNPQITPIAQIGLKQTVSC